ADVRRGAARPARRGRHPGDDARRRGARYDPGHRQRGRDAARGVPLRLPLQAGARQPRRRDHRAAVEGRHRRSRPVQAHRRPVPGRPRWADRLLRPCGRPSRRAPADLRAHHGGPPGSGARGRRETAVRLLPQGERAAAARRCRRLRPPVHRTGLRGEPLHAVGRRRSRAELAGVGRRGPGPPGARADGAGRDGHGPSPV
ncbi:MAG: hypothetical protein AVDCRST_MAG34-2936, partial [uncultured Nocardioidaceae bacterium]